MLRKFTLMISVVFGKRVALATGQKVRKAWFYLAVWGARNS